MKVKFIDTIGISKEFYVSPAINEIPDWYKKTNPYGNYNGDTPGSYSQTIKKCLPVFDAMTTGYIIKTHVDIRVIKNNNAPYYCWALFDAIKFHPIEQAKYHPDNNGHDYPKFISPWSIKTPKGYSCLFLNPMHHENKYIRIFPGIIDTDKFFSQISFPFVLNDSNWEGLIPAGTPIVQVIPFKRDSFSMKFGNSKDLMDANDAFVKTRSRLKGGYKKVFWSRKNYK